MLNYSKEKYLMFFYFHLLFAVWVLNARHVILCGFVNQKTNSIRIYLFILYYCIAVCVWNRRNRSRTYLNSIKSRVRIRYAIRPYFYLFKTVAEIESAITELQSVALPLRHTVITTTERFERPCMMQADTMDFKSMPL